MYSICLVTNRNSRDCSVAPEPIPHGLAMSSCTIHLATVLMLRAVTAITWRRKKSDGCIESQGI